MKKLLIIIGFIAAIIATVLSTTQYSNLAFTPILIAFISGLIILFLSKKHKSKTKSIQYIFLLVIISLSLTIYKNVIHSTEVNDVEKPEQLNQNSEKNLKDSDKIIEDKKIDENL